jgi:hypothetical protein
MGSSRVDTSSSHTTVRRPVRRGAAAVASLAVIAALVVACTPPAPTLPSCPARAEVQLEPPDPVNYSLPRAVSPDGTWVALSRSVGDGVVISARRADAGAPSQALGSIPYTDTADQQPRVSVAADGARVLWAGNMFAPLPEAPTSPLYRWVRATGVVETVTPPVVASPPPGTAYPVNLRALSADGERAIWSQAFYQVDTGFQHVRTITHTGTDTILSQQQMNDSPIATLSTGARTETVTWTGAGDGYLVVDLDTLTSTSLAPALEAAQAAYPGGGFRPVISSDDGQFTLLQRPFETPATYVLWDHATEQVSLVAQGPGIRLDTVDDTGTVVYSVDTGTTIRSVHRAVDGSERTVADAPMLRTWRDDPMRPLTSADRRTSFYSEPVPVLGNRLVARRCR